MSIFNADFGTGLFEFLGALWDVVFNKTPLGILFFATLIIAFIAFVKNFFS